MPNVGAIFGISTFWAQNSFQWFVLSAQDENVLIKFGNSIDNLYRERNIAFHNQ